MSSHRMNKDTSGKSWKKSTAWIMDLEGSQAPTMIKSSTFVTLNNDVSKVPGNKSSKLNHMLKNTKTVRTHSRFKDCYHGPLPSGHRRRRTRLALQVTL